MIPLLRCDHGWRESVALATRLLAASVDRLELHDGTVAIAFNRGRWAITVLLARACADQPFVIVPSFLCTAVAEAVLAAGKRPRFVEMGTDLNLDPAAVAAALDDDVAAIVVPHVYGAAADIETIARMGAERGVLVIDDAASAMGIEHGERLLGTFGDAGVFSAAQQKSLVAGQGGLLVCNSDRARAAMEGYAAPRCGRLRAAREALRWQWSDRWHHRAPTLRYWVERVFGRGASTGGSC